MFCLTVMLIPILSAVPSGEVPLISGVQLFLDDPLIAYQENLERVVTPPVKLPEPVVTGPEDKCFQPYFTVLRDPDTRRYRMWYGVPGSESVSHLAYMESEDAVHWIRPHRVLDDPGPIQFGCSVLDEGPAAKDAAARYKYGYWHDGGLNVAVSPDGLAWKPLVPGVVLKHNHDITAIYRDQVRNRYIALPSSYTTGEGWTGQRRIPMESASEDLIHWKEPWRIIEPDSRDSGETQFYCMSGLIQRGPLLIGLVKVLRDELHVEDAPAGAYGLGYTTLAWSRDGDHWVRDTVPFMDRDHAPGTWDHAMTWADCQLPVGDEVYIYYGGYAWGHKHERFTQRQIGLARMPRDRYVARAAGEKAGVLRTVPCKLAGKVMTANAKVDGEMSVRLLGVDAQPIPGFGFEDCKPIAGDSIAHVVSWKQGAALPTDKPVQIEFRLKNAMLYAFEVL